MARVDVLREARSGQTGDWQLCFQWCRYRLDDGVQYGYRFVWRRPEDGSIQGARGQARIPSIEQATALMNEASQGGWGDRNGDELLEAAGRLRQAGCVVDLMSGYVGWPGKDAALNGSLSAEQFEEARLIREWAH